MSSFEHDYACCGDFSCLTGTNLVLQIFSKLHLRDLFKVRRVCKSWFDAILSSQFLNLWKDEEQQVCAVLLLGTKHVSSLSRNCSELWYPFSCNSKRSLSILPMPDVPEGAEFMGLFSSHGLVCGQLVSSDGHIRLVVGNPLTNTWKKLPVAPVSYTFGEKLSCSMERDPVSGCYTVIVIVIPRVRYTDSPHYYVCQYESNLGAWQLPPQITSRIHVLPIGSVVLAYSSYFAVYNPLSMSWFHLQIVLPENEEYEMVGGTGCSPLAGFKYEGKYILITTFTKAKVSIFRPGRAKVVGVGVWELNEENYDWKLLSRAMFKDLYGDSGFDCEQLKCQLVGDMIILSVSACYDIYFGFSAPVAYSLSTSTWTTAFSIEEKHETTSNAQCSYAFIPSLKAQA